jgi:hypothetical protein
VYSRYADVAVTFQSMTPAEIAVAQYRSAAPFLQSDSGQLRQGSRARETMTFSHFAAEQEVGSHVTSRPQERLFVRPRRFLTVVGSGVFHRSRWQTRKKKALPIQPESSPRRPGDARPVPTVSRHSENGLDSVAA